uniref:hypothetical protein n=1 Tax=Pararhizobium sp. IMCC3301 TaxID=3067904 RepID=UPI0027414BC6|nr:hypothetical protein [Pararhizobium sp. IMCC3301]
MPSHLVAMGSVMGLTEAGVLSVLLTLVLGFMAIAVALLLRQTYREQIPERQRARERVRSKFPE